ncbi:Aste57867_11540 [Aphanomyces stellatus]|uniref:Aste57867_11540 protein n=1 Tax=Aphanomyces stellatus TaxID=120398 RepID=A0A485KTU4_9STRA|nr:hypothetical protein As57867_011497 [Aphanomyces stellatus]VFT88401.1 Aste57867_11540 [Aphanomyces stellatus]
MSGTLLGCQASYFERCNLLGPLPHPLCTIYFGMKSPSDAADVRRLHKQRHDREMKRLARQEYLSEIKQLNHCIRVMTQKLSMLVARRGPSCTLLSWDQVVRALAEDVMSATEANVKLKRALHMTQRMAAMVRVTLCEPMMMEPMYNPRSWRDNALFQGTELRRVGAEWLTSRAYTSMPQAMRSPVALGLASRGDIAVSIDSGAVHMQVTNDMIFHGSLAETTARVWALQTCKARLESPMPEVAKHWTLEAVDERTAYTRTEMLGRRCVQCLSRFYHEQDDVNVMVCVAVHHDEVFPYGPDECTTDNTTWVVVRALGPSTCLVRQMFLFTQGNVARDTPMAVSTFAAAMHRNVFPNQPYVAPQYSILTDEDHIPTIRHCLEADFDAIQRRMEVMVTNVMLPVNDYTGQ